MFQLSFQTHSNKNKRCDTPQNRIADLPIMTKNAFNGIFRRECGHDYNVVEFSAGYKHKKENVKPGVRVICLLIKVIELSDSGQAEINDNEQQY
jgi:hypothetical protein